MEKEDLLKTGYFKNNNFLDKYLYLFNEPVLENFEKHHIIPRAFFKIKKIEVDNSKNNLKNISMKNHYLAHYYLTKCTSGTLKRLMNYYFTKMTVKLSKVAFEIFSQIYEAMRKNDKENHLNYIKSAHNNINNYNKLHPKRTSLHIQHMSEAMKKYWKNKKKEEQYN